MNITLSAGLIKRNKTLQDVLLENNPNYLKSESQLIYEVCVYLYLYSYSIWFYIRLYLVAMQTMLCICTLIFQQRALRSQGFTVSLREHVRFSQPVSACGAEIDQQGAGELWQQHGLEGKMGHHRERELHRQV